MVNQVVSRIVMLGPPGSGKGTQAKMLAKALSVPHISTGDMFRAAVAEQSEFGQQVDSLLKAGQLVPDKLTNQVVAERLAQADAARGFVLDGYPRNLNQALSLAGLASEVHALLVELPDDEAVKRIAGRRTCSSCGAIFHVAYKPPKVVGKCDVCGSTLIQRNDETEEIVRGRLVIYHRTIEPLVQFYRQQNKLLVVDGLPSIPQVSVAIRQALKV